MSNVLFSLSHELRCFYPFQKSSVSNWIRVNTIQVFEVGVCHVYFECSDS